MDGIVAISTNCSDGHPIRGTEYKRATVGRQQLPHASLPHLSILLDPGRRQRLLDAHVALPQVVGKDEALRPSQKAEVSTTILLKLSSSPTPYQTGGTAPTIGHQ